MRKNLSSFALLCLSCIVYSAYAYDFSAVNADNTVIYYNYMPDSLSVKVTCHNDSEIQYSGAVVIPDTVVFQDVSYPVVEIDSSAFAGDFGLTSVVMPNSITAIGNSAFSSCRNMASITLSDNLTRIGTNAFFSCNKITSLVLPESLTELGEGALSYCETLRNITLPSQMTSIPYEAFRNSGLTNITLDNISVIGERAFLSCGSLEKIWLGNQVDSIKDYAFGLCLALKEIHIDMATPPIINNLTFYNINKSACVVYVPQGAVDTYKTTSLWADFPNIVEEGSDGIRSISADHAQIVPVSGGIRIDSKTAAKITVFDIGGRQIYRSVSDGKSIVPLQQGVYLVQVQNDEGVGLQKIIVY